MKLVSKNAAKLAMLFGIIKPIGTFLQSRLSSHIAGATGCLDLNRIISFVFSDEVSVVSKVIQINIQHPHEIVKNYGRPKFCYVTIQRVYLQPISFNIISTIPKTNSSISAEIKKAFFLHSGLETQTLIDWMSAKTLSWKLPLQSSVQSSLVRLYYQTNICQFGTSCKINSSLWKICTFN